MTAQQRDSRASFEKGDFSGWLIVDKPLGLSSFGVVSCCKKLIKEANQADKKLSLKVGHGGTLDPLATGILPIAIGKATKTIPLLMNQTKTYIFEVKWGEERLTDDAEGHVIQTSSYRPCAQEITKALEAFKGTILQRPPLFCALKVNGRRAYQRARAGQSVILKERSVDIYRLSLLKCSQETASFEIDCGKGFYIRALARDLARLLGTCGYVLSLRRTRVGPFLIEKAISLDNLKRLGHKVTEEMLPIDVLLDDIPALHVDMETVKRLYQGQRVFGHWDLGSRSFGEERVLIKSQGQTFGVGHWNKSEGFLHLSQGLRSVEACEFENG